MTTKTPDQKERKRVFIKKLVEFVKNNKENAGAIIWLPVFIGIFLSMATFVFPVLFGVVTIILQVLLVFLSIEVFKCFAPEMEEYKRKKFVIAYKVSMFVGISYIGAMSFYALQARTKIDLSLFVIMGLMISALITMVISQSEKVKALDKSIIEAESLEERFGLKTCNPGDIVLCQDMIETEKGLDDTRVILPYKDRFLHMLILGATGTGKTSQVILPMINQDLQNPEVGVIVIEPKGDLAQQAMFISKHYGREAKYFDPAMDNCPHFNPLAGREMDVVENIATTFRMLTPDSGTYFLNMGEQLVRYSVKLLKRLDKAEGIEGKYANLLKMSQLVQNTGGEGRNLVGKLQKVDAPTEQEQGENNEICSYFLNDYFPERSKAFENTSDIRAQLTKICSNEFLRDVLNPDVQKGQSNEIDFDKALADGEVLCISTAQGTLRGLSRFIGYFLILQLQSAVFRRPGDENSRRACFLYIDEFQTYSTPGFADMLTQGRSYRVASHLATQARSQMAMGGGKDGKDFVNLVSTNARNIILFPGLSADDAKYYEAQFGEVEVVKTSVTKTKKTFNPFMGGFRMLGHPSVGERTDTSMEPLMSVTDIIYKEFGQIIFSIIKNNTPQHARVGKVSWIDKELKAEIDKNIAEYLALHTKKTSEELQADSTKSDIDGFEFEDPDANDGFEDLGGEEIDISMPKDEDPEDIFSGVM